MAARPTHPDGDEKRSKKGANTQLMKQTAAVRNMRDNYARNMFYTWVVYYLANFLAFLLCGLFFFV